ncbi:MAG TPA: shikimate kinase [Candidatus Binataceae bacterium]|nr:shikimate kinase [Candidatus Binataceae bacterium]
MTDRATPKLILTGFMATGKSVIGPLVAHRLGWPFADIDAAVAARAGKPVAAIFADDGEARMRALEREAIAAVARDRRRCAQCGRRRPAVIATGGGAIVDEANFAELHAAGVVICLSARPDVIARRVGRSAARRPKLVEGGKPLLERINELMAERARAYARADATIDTSDLAIDTVVERVIDAYVAHGKLRCNPSA